MTPTIPPRTLAQVAQLRLEMRRAAKAKIVAQSAVYTRHYA
jgi:hypothetical protein